MSMHSYSRRWLHVTWATLRREPMLFKETGIKVSRFLYDYARSKDIYMKANYINPEHVHALIDLPTKYSIEELLKLLKGASSHWINANRLVRGHFAWGRGYGVFSVSDSNVDAVVRYIKNQEEHHRTRPFAEEFASFLETCGLELHEEE